MQFQIQVVCIDEAGRQTTQPVASFGRDATQLLPATLGMSLDEGKSILGSIQVVVTR